MDFDPALEQRLLSAVSRDNLMNYTSEIAKGVRTSGDPAELEALQYVQGVLAGWGYRTEILRHPGFVSVPGESSLTVRNPGSSDDGFTAMGHTFGPSTLGAGVTGRLVPVAVRSNLRGNVAFAIGMASAKVTLEAQEAGASAIVFVSDDYLHQSCVSPLWGTPAPAGIETLPAIPGVTVKRADGDRLKTLMEKGPVTATVKTKVATYWTELPLLTADLDGQEENTFLLFSCHIDSWFYGAMDNGSANATAMEVARIMAQSRQSLRRGLRLAFWSGHSHGRFAGSNWYCDTRWAELLDRCIGHVNVDSTGGQGASVMEELPIMPQSFGLAAEALEVATGRTLLGKRIGRFGDQSFYGLGLTSTFATFSEQPKDPTGRSVGFHTGGNLSGGLGWWWHTEFDTLDKVDPENLERDTRVYLSTVYRLLASRYLPYDFRALTAYLKEQTLALSAKLGSRLDLEPVLSRLGALTERLGRFYALIESGRIEPSMANAVMLRLSQALVPCAFKENERSDADSFAEIPAYPPFGGAEALADASGGQASMLHALYLRRRNRVVTALTDALRSVEAL